MKQVISIKFKVQFAQMLKGRKNCSCLSLIICLNMPISLCKAKVSKPRVIIGFFNFDLKSQHAQNEFFYIAKDCPLILDFVVVEVS
jgi:hypothetical protein